MSIGYVVRLTRAQWARGCALSAPDKCRETSSVRYNTSTTTKWRTKKTRCRQRQKRNCRSSFSLPLVKTSCEYPYDDYTRCNRVLCKALIREETRKTLRRCTARAVRNDARDPRSSNAFRDVNDRASRENWLNGERPVPLFYRLGKAVMTRQRYIQEKKGK